MRVQLTARFAFNNGNYKKITWVELDPKAVQRDPGTQEIIKEVELNAEELKREYRRIFTQYLNEGKAVTLEDAKGKIFIVKLGNVNDIELDAVELEEVI